MSELPDAEIEQAEGVNVAHSHHAITSEDGSLLEHLQSVHGLAVGAALSHGTQAGLHDRLHDESKAIDDPA